MQSNSLSDFDSEGFDSKGFASSLGDEPSRWLRDTVQIDSRSTTVRILAKRITQLVSGERAKAVAIHDYIKSLPFACHNDYFYFRASDVIKQGSGDCHTKGALFVALLRAIRIPARLRFVTLPSGFMRGLLDTGQPTITHAIGEVLLGGRWYQTDTYVMDAALSREAREMLRNENALVGYGVHAQGDQDWNAFDNAHTHYTSADPSSSPLSDWGVAHDPALFYDNPAHKLLRPSFIARIKWQVGVHVINHRVEKIRNRADEMVGSAA
jgi:transglutaminase-like putative cysteine protease